MMASFALVKLKCNGRIEAVPVKNMVVKRKMNGQRRFEPYMPTSVTDFEVSTRHKYAVLCTDADGNVRRWYAMVERLGASPDEVLAEKHDWPESSQPCLSSEQKITHLKKRSKYQASQAVQTMPQNDPQQLMDLLKKEVRELGNKIFLRLDGIESQIRSRHVQDWVNSIHPLPGIIGASDVNAVQVKNKKGDKSVADTASDCKAEDSVYGDAKSSEKSCHVHSKSEDPPSQKTERDLSESEVTSESESNFPGREIFYSFLSGVV